MEQQKTLRITKPVIKRRRAWPPAIWKLWRTHAHQAGEIITAWNDLHAACYELFAALSEAKSPGHMQIAYGIWHSVTNDSIQRVMMLAAARGALDPKSKIFTQIEWLKISADNLSSFRNDPAHTPIAFRPREDGLLEVVPNIVAAKSAAVDRLQKTPLNVAWRRIRGDL
jgi:hypothetical protein